MGMVEAAMRKVSRPAAAPGALTRTSRASKPAPQTTFSKAPGGVHNTAGSRELEKEIVEIERLSLDDLRIRWRNLSSRLAPAHLSRGLLARILAYRVQAQACGDLDRNTARALERWNEPNEREQTHGHAVPGTPNDSADSSSAPERRVPEPLILKVGTLLTREWQRRMETVMVVAEGFAWNGEIFARLSAVAHAITGTKWNGHRFFGVRPQDRSLRRSPAADEAPVRVGDHRKVRTTKPGSIRERRSTSSTIAPGVSGVSQ